MRSRPDELEAFKTEIDLVTFAQDQGYEIDRRRTSRTSVAMRHEVNGDRIILALGSNGHYIYASVHDPTDHGSIIDFVQKRSGGSLGEVRKKLRPWIGGDLTLKPRASSANQGSKQPLEPVRTDFAAVRAAYEAMTPIDSENAYLTVGRAIPAEVYLHPRFVGRLRVDARDNVVFPHVQSGGELTGFEIKNDGWTGFASGGAKRLFCSGFGEDDTHLVICESGIDALSYAALFGVDGKRFLSTAGALNPEQIALLRSAIQKLPDGAEVVLAVDADKGGDAIAEQVEAIYNVIGDGRVTLRRDSPSSRGKDWNDVLRASPTFHGVRKEEDCSPVPNPARHSRRSEDARPGYYSVIKDGFVVLETKSFLRAAEYADEYPADDIVRPDRD